MTYNILDGGVGREALISNIIKEVDADVILLQEVIDTSWIRALATELNLQCFVTESNTKRAMALLTRLRVASFGSYRAVPIRNVLLRAQIEYLPKQHFSLCGLHLVAHYHLFFELWRYFEINRVLNCTTQLRTAPVILGGDFNSIAPGETIKLVKLPPLLRLMVYSQGGRIANLAINRIHAAGFRDCFRLLHSNNEGGFTVPAREPHARLDYFFVNAPLTNQVRFCNVVTKPDITAKYASDHLPLLLELDL